MPRKRKDDKAATASAVDEAVESIPVDEAVEPGPPKKAKSNNEGEPQNDAAVAPEVELDAAPDESSPAKVGKDATEPPDGESLDSLLALEPHATIDVNSTKVPGPVEHESGKGGTELMDVDLPGDNQDLDKQMMPPPGRGSSQPPLNGIPTVRVNLMIRASPICLL
jgi:hypothetical protein